MAYVKSSLPGTISGTASLRRYETNFNGSQIITLPSNYNTVFSVEVEGQGALSTSQYNLLPPNQIEVLDIFDSLDYVVILYQENVGTFSGNYSKSEIDTLLLEKEDLSNKQDSLTFDGTGNKYPTIDTVNNAFLRNTRLFARTGIATRKDNFELTVFDLNTITIKAVDSAVFWDELFNINAVSDDAIKSFPEINYPLTQLITATGGNINTVPLVTDGIYVRYLGYDKNGKVVSSPDSFVDNSAIVQLGFTTVVKLGSTVSFLGGVTPNARNVFSQPILANLNDLDRITTNATTDITINYNSGSTSLKSNPGTITGISINWRGINNPNNTSSIDKFNYLGDNIVDFISLTPLFLSQTSSPTIHTLWTETESGIQINNSFFNTTTQLRDTLITESYGVKRVLIGLRGGIFIQESEFATNAGYTTLSQAQANVFTHQFTNSVIPPGIVIEIARIIFKKGVTDFSNSNEFSIIQTAGGAGSGGGISTVGDATTVTKGILKLAGDLSGTADLPTVPGLVLKANDTDVLHITGNETFTGTKSTTLTGAQRAFNITNNGSLEAIRVTSNGTGNGLYFNNSGSGFGIQTDNIGSSIGNIINNFGTGNSLVLNNTATASGKPFSYQKDFVEKLFITDSGNISAQSFIKSGGTSSQFLKADGSIDSTVYQSVLTNPVTGTGVSGQVSFFNGTNSVIGDTSFTWDNTNKKLSINNNIAGQSNILYGRNTINTGSTSITLQNDTTATIGITASGSNFGGSLSNTGVLGVTNSMRLVLITNGEQATTGSQPIDFMAGGYNVSPTMRVVAGNPGRVLIGTTTDNSTDRLQVNGSVAITNGGLSVTGGGIAGNSFIISGVTSSSSITLASQLNGVYQACFRGDGALRTVGQGLFGATSPAHTDTIDGSAQLEIRSTTKGFLLPKMTSAQRIAIASPTTGLFVYQTDGLEGLYEKKSTGWVFLATDGTTKTRKDIAGTSYTLLSTDNNYVLYTTNASPVTITIPSGLTVNQEYELIQYGTGQVSFVTSGTTFRYQDYEIASTYGQYSRVSMSYIDTETYQLLGELAMI